jgi:hypothetical protein
MQLIGHTCPPCPLCGAITIFTVEEEALRKWRGGRHIQDCFGHWSEEDRETLMTGYCPPCWEEGLPEDEESEDYEWALYDTDEMFESDLLDVADDYTYDADWYVD